MLLSALLVASISARKAHAVNQEAQNKEAEIAAAPRSEISASPASLSYNVNLNNEASQVKHVVLTNKGSQDLELVIGAPTQPDYMIMSPQELSPTGGTITIPGKVIHSTANTLDLAIQFIPPGPGRNLTATIPIMVEGLSRPSAIVRLVGRASLSPKGLWTGGFQDIYEFQGRALQASGEPSPSLKFASTTYANALSIAFDPGNNLWIFYGQTTGGPPPLVQVAQSEFSSLKKGKSIKPTVVIEGAGGPGIAFDGDGNLWSCDQSRRAVLEFRSGQIKRSGTPAPDIVLESNNFAPQAIRFDRQNNLWVEQFQQPYDPSNPLQMWKFAPGERNQTGSANPGLVLILPDAIEPIDFAFDQAGNLWVAGNSSIGDALEMFPAEQLDGTGQLSPSAAVTITSSAFGKVFFNSGSCLGGIDFDPFGNLWVSVGTNNSECQALTQLVAFAPSQLSSGGSLVPSLAIYQNLSKSNLMYPGPVRFGPIP